MDAVSYSHSAKQAKRIKKFINEPDSSSGVVTVPKVIASGETITIPAGRMAVLPNVQVDGTLNIEGDVFIPSGATFSKVVETEGNQSISGIKTFSSSPIVPTPTNATDAANKAYVDTKANLASPAFTGTVTLPSTTSIGTISSTELGYIDGVTSNIQNQLDSKNPNLVSGTNIKTINGSTILESGNINLVDLTTNQSISGIKTFSSSPIVPTPTNATDAANKAYVDTKANLASPAFTGTPAAPTASVGTNTTQLATTAFVLANSVQDADFAKSLAANGYQKLPGGLIIQWGTRPTGTGNVSVTFPIAFPNACVSVVVSGNYNGSAYADTVTSKSTTSFSGWSQHTSSYYIAIGY